MTHAAYVYDIEHVIVDNLQFMTSYVRYSYMYLNVCHASVDQIAYFIFSSDSKNVIFLLPKKMNFVIFFQPWRRSIFYPESCYFCTEEFCEHQKRTCDVGYPPKKGLFARTFCNHKCTSRTYNMEIFPVSYCGFFFARRSGNEDTPMTSLDETLTDLLKLTPQTETRHLLL